ncbi:Hypothetical predicted protein [Octopus vulgaris]|uniref:Uncharacterized protein n=1 Tax=Octopus vulgaris TaxID=6645 RepID=A0AA36AU47_OCTVU|nr:Hypothetical predicted protein [Octopus vulgaris]
MLARSHPCIVISMVSKSSVNSTLRHASYTRNSCSRTDILAYLKKQMILLAYHWLENITKTHKAIYKPYEVKH